VRAWTAVPEERQPMMLCRYCGSPTEDTGLDGIIMLKQHLCMACFCREEGCENPFEEDD